MKTYRKITKTNEVVKRRKRYWVIVLIAIVISLTFMYLACSEFINDDKKVVAEINGNKIFGEEFKLYQIREKAKVFNYYKAKFSDFSDQNFYDEKYKINGLSANQMLANLAWDSLITDKTYELMAFEKGIVDGFDFNYIKAEWKLFNEEGAKLKNDGKLIGVQSMYLEQYVSYWVDKLKNELINIFSETKKIDYLEAKSYFDKQNDKFPIMVKLQKVSVGFGVQSLSKIKAEEIFSEIKIRAEHGENLELIIKEFKKQSATKFFNFEERSFSLSDSYRLRPEEIATAKRLQKNGQISDVFMVGESKLELLKRISAEKTVDFLTNRQAIEKMIIGEKFLESVESKKKSLKIKKYEYFKST